MQAQAQEDLAYLREQRTKRDTDIANMGITDLTTMHQIWVGLADEHKRDPSMRAYCVQQRVRYSTKIGQLRKEHADWGLDGTAKSKAVPGTPPPKTAAARTPGAPRKATAPHDTTVPSHTGSPRAHAPRPSATSTSPASNLQKRAGERKRRVEEDALRAQARAQEVSRKHANRQALLDAKADAVRIQNNNLKQKLDEITKGKAPRVAEIRAKVGPAPKGSADRDVLKDEGDLVRQPATKRVCTKCGTEHASFKEWRTCNLRGPLRQDTGSEEGDSNVVVV
jgi:hypothetical protein